MKHKVAKGTAEELPTTTTHVTVITMLVLPKREHPQRSRLITALICLTAVRILRAARAFRFVFATLRLRCHYAWLKTGHQNALVRIHARLASSI